MGFNLRYRVKSLGVKIVGFRYRVKGLGVKIFGLGFTLGFKV